MDETDLAKQAQAGDVAAQWKLNLQADTTTEITATSCRTLKLRRLERRLLKHVPRKMDLVKADLRDKLRDLATGKLPWPLFLWGSSGAGKTSAALALADFAASACYWTADNLGDQIMAGTPGETAETWELIAKKDLSILDEIAERRNIGDLAYRVVKKFADLRETQASRVAVYVSNVSPAELQSLFDDRIASRMLCGTVHKLDDQDRRFQR